MATGIDRFYEEAAYVAALMEYLICHKSDHETDAEIADILQQKPFMVYVIMDIMRETSNETKNRTVGSGC